MSTKTQTPRKTNQYHIKRLHGHRAMWFAALAVGLLGIQVLARPPQTVRGDVLAYATNVSVSGLLSATNQQRAANGLGALAINSQLNSGAQAKANHMIANNYWAHTAPDGTEPWYFFESAGYPYIKAGENLAYGFDGSSEIVDAWMDSPGHRANILGDYKDVGFGFTNGDGYQGAENTVIVAFYGKTADPAPAPAPAVKSTPAPVATTTPTPEPEPEPEPVVAEPVVEESTAQPEPEPVSTEPEAPAASSQNVTTFDNILNGNAGWAMYASLGFIGATTVGFATTHTQLVRRSWRQTKHFVFVHPALDAAVLMALIATLLTSSVGFIR